MSAIILREVVYLFLEILLEFNEIFLPCYMKILPKILTFRLNALSRDGVTFLSVEGPSK